MLQGPLSDNNGVQYVLECKLPALAEGLSSNFVWLMEIYASMCENSVSA